MTRKLTKTEQDTIVKIAERAVFFFPDTDWRYFYMDIVSTIIGGCELRLNDFLTAGCFDFVHDIVGIERHLNHKTFKLEDCFLPRFAVVEIKK